MNIGGPAVLLPRVDTRETPTKILGARCVKTFSTAFFMQWEGGGLWRSSLGETVGRMGGMHREGSSVTGKEFCSCAEGLSRL